METKSVNRSGCTIDMNPQSTPRECDDGHDRALLRRYVQAADTEALSELLVRHAHAAYRLALHFCSNSHDAEDAVQIASLHIVRQAARFDEQREGTVRL